MMTSERLLDATVPSCQRARMHRSWAQSGHPDGPRVRAFAGVRSPFVPLGLVAAQQVLHRSGANQWFSFPFHVLAVLWLGIVVYSARSAITRFGGWLAVAGASMNGIIVAVTHGMMPVDPASWDRAYGGPLVNKERMHVFANDRFRRFFGDRFAIPSIHMVISLGDLLLLFGATVALAGFCYSRRTPGHQLPRSKR